ncbi:MAG: hypothetical protein NWP69_02560 [Congregibacter sp.]|nr:hypothetical protein [Congregibacter sp.]MDP5069837.1 hypothetical protein [Congregibacter sp.]
MNLTTAAYLACLWIVALINLLPAIGLLGADRLARTYGVEIASAELELLLRHRALLFGIIGGFVMYALWAPQFRLASLLLAGVSMGGFLQMSMQGGPYNDQIGMVVKIDGVGLVALAAGLLLHLGLAEH